MLVVAALAARADEGAQPDLLPTVGSIERLDPRFDALVPRDAVIEVLASGFEWAEGPVWLKGEQALLFSDIPRNRVMRFKDGAGLSVFLEPAGFTGPAAYGKERGSNGLTLDRQGSLISCEHGDRRVSRLTPGGGKRTVADNYQGKRFNSPNDCAVHSSGAIYFTDPPYGLPKGWDDERRELDFCGVYRVAPDGEVTLLCKTMTRPNGICFSPDEKRLYVAQSDPAAPLWKVFTVKPDGTLDEGRTFFDGTKLFKERKKGLPDGLKVDLAGNVFATGPGRRARDRGRRHAPGHVPHRAGDGQLRLRRRRSHTLHDGRLAPLPCPAHDRRPAPWAVMRLYRPMIKSIPEKMASICRLGTLPTRSVNCRLSTVTSCDTFATESRSRPVCLALSSTLPGAIDQRRLLVRTTHTTVAS